MSWLYSRELVEEYSEAKCLDGEQCALWNGTHTQPASWLPAKTTKHCRLSRSGLTYKPLMDDLGEAVLMSFLEDFPAKTYPVQEKEPALTESEAVCGDTWQESSMKFDLNTSSWRTHRFLWEEDLPESSVTLPKWGMMRDGVLWERTTSPLPTKGTESGSWPTPTANEDAAGTPEGKMQWMLTQAAKSGCKTRKEYQESKQWPTPCAGDYRSPNLNPCRNGQKIEPASGHALPAKVGGQLNPTWVEWLMGWPIGWTDLNALETDKFLMWPHTPGNY